MTLKQWIPMVCHPVIGVKSSVIDWKIWRTKEKESWSSILPNWLAWNLNCDVNFTTSIIDNAWSIIIKAFDNPFSGNNLPKNEKKNYFFSLYSVLCLETRIFPGVISGAFRKGKKGTSKKPSFKMEIPKKTEIPSKMMRKLRNSKYHFIKP